MANSPKRKADPSKKSAGTARGACLCGAVKIEIDLPAFWAWHDHGRSSRLAHGAAYATYIGCWRKYVRMTGKSIARYEEKTGNARSFCARCGSPILYERKSSKTMVNVPRALFASRTGREPRYHLNIAERQDWEYAGAPLVPLKGYPGVVWERPKSRKPAKGLADFLAEG